MMKRFGKTVIMATVATMVLSGALITGTTYAAETKKNLEVYYNDIKVKYNNQKVSIDSELEPFLVDGSTFIPLRKLGEVFGKKVTWDADTYTVNVTDTGTGADQTTVDELNSKIDELTAQLNTANSQISAKDTEIASLNATITALEDDLEEAENGADLDDLEADLNDDYSDYEDTDGDITLDGDEDDITVTIEVDPDAWDDLSSSSKEAYLQNIVDDILDQFDDADVEGTVESNDDSDELTAFTVDSDGDVDLDSEADLDELEDSLNDDYGNYKDVTLSITLTGDEDDITVKVYMTEDEWDSLTTTQQNALEDDLVDAVQDEFEDADVTGYIYNSSSTSTKLDSF